MSEACRGARVVSWCLSYIIQDTSLDTFQVASRYVFTSYIIHYMSTVSSMQTFHIVVSILLTLILLRYIFFKHVFLLFISKYELCICSIDSKNKTAYHVHLGYIAFLFMQHVSIFHIFPYI